MVEIPAPPFERYAEGRHFHRLLLLYLRELKGAGEPVGFHQYLLIGLLNVHAPASGGAGDRPPGCSACSVRYPCRTVLAAVSDSYFPVPWTAVAVGGCLLDAGVLDPEYDTVQPGRLVWGRKVRQSATWSASGRWRWQSDAGGREYYTDEQLAGLLLIETARGRYPYHFVSDEIEDEVAALRPAAAERLTTWERGLGTPVWREERRFGVPRQRGAPPR